MIVKMEWSGLGEAILKTHLHMKKVQSQERTFSSFPSPLPIRPQEIGQKKLDTNIFSPSPKL
jgi:hypothetical protein